MGVGEVIETGLNSAHSALHVNNVYKVVLKCFSSTYDTKQLDLNFSDVWRSSFAMGGDLFVANFLSEQFWKKEDQETFYGTIDAGCCAIPITPNNAVFVKAIFCEYASIGHQKLMMRWNANIVFPCPFNLDPHFERAPPHVIRCLCALATLSNYPSLIISIVNDFKLCHLYTLNDFRTIVKNIDLWAKKGQRWIEGWSDCVSWLNFAGFNLDSKMTAEKKVEVDSWLLTPFSNLESEPHAWRLAMVTSLSRRVPFAPVSRVISPLLADFVANSDNWVRPGAGSESVNIRGVKTGRARLAFALNHTVEEICAMVSDATFCDSIRVNIKVELGQRRRLFASVGEVINIGQAFLSQWIEASFRNVRFEQKESTLFMSSEEMWHAWLGLTTRMNGRHSIVYPFDASSFDHTIGKNEIDACYDFCATILKKCGVHKDVTHLLEINRQQYFNLRVVGYGTLQHGMPSGLRWTALFDTLVNLGRASVTQDISRLLGGDDRWFKICQGDDALIVCKHPREYFLYNCMIDAIGVGSNPHKNYLCVNNYEYLRKHHTSMGPSGYLARKVPGMLYRNPMSYGVQPWFQVFREAESQLGVILSRGGNCDVMRAGLHEWASSEVGSESDLSIWLHSPTNVGGFGMYPLKRSWLSIADETSNTVEMVVDSIEGRRPDVSISFGQDSERKRGQLLNDYVQAKLFLDTSPGIIAFLSNKYGDSSLNRWRKNAIQRILKKSIQKRVARVFIQYSLIPRGLGSFHNILKQRRTPSLNNFTHDWMLKKSGQLIWYKKGDVCGAIADQLVDDALISNNISLLNTISANYPLTMAMKKRSAKQLFRKWITTGLEMTVPWIKERTSLGAMRVGYLCQDELSRRFFGKRHLTVGWWKECCLTVEEHFSRICQRSWDFNVGD